MARSTRAGFALPAVLAVTGVVTIVFLVAITALTSLQAEAMSARSRVRFLQRAMTAEATVAYMAMTSPFSYDSIAPGTSLTSDVSDNLVMPDDPAAAVHLDGRPYLMDVAGPLTVSLQDTAGLVNLTYGDDGVHRRLAERVGLSASQIAAAYPMFRDYMDVDDLRLPNGAERAEYGGGLPPNRPMLRASEWLSLLDVRKSANQRAWRATKPLLIADASVSTFNVNTAPEGALEIMMGVTARQAQQAIEQRRATPFLAGFQFDQFVGGSYAIDPERIYTTPSGQVALTVRDARSAWVYRAVIAPQPFGVVRPLWIKQTELIEAPGRASADTTNAARLPYAPD